MPEIKADRAGHLSQTGQVETPIKWGPRVTHELMRPVVFFTPVSYYGVDALLHLALKRMTMTTFKEKIAARDYHTQAAQAIQEEIEETIQQLAELGLVIPPEEAEPVKAIYRYVSNLSAIGELVSATILKEKVPSARRYTNRALTSILNTHPNLVDINRKNEFGIKVFAVKSEALAAA